MTSHVVYGQGIFVTISPGERHNYLAIRLSRYRARDPYMAHSQEGGSERHWSSRDSQNASGKNSTCGDPTHDSEPFPRTLGSFSYPAENGGHDVSRPMDDPDRNRQLGTQLIERHVVQENRMALTQHHRRQKQLVP